MHLLGFHDVDESLKVSPVRANRVDAEPATPATYEGDEPVCGSMSRRTAGGQESEDEYPCRGQALANATP